MSRDSNKNQIVKVVIELDESNHWQVHVTKEFEEQYGGGSQVFNHAGITSVHRALDIAREMVTWSPAQNVGR